ncbi:restriction endonuclease [Micromonospora sp. WMMD1082]|uniref:restriction endonuclease n=1 Tax=Micromonospora sp. WMMD1082 TaxID=3016104 RepID=UPI002416758F|nr:restriction endonuclease [Micromonospora sp. WMMD1082]MDG4795080.1 restriction endonuclease [Micromonospora sp. WMMD1082]
MANYSRIKMEGFLARCNDVSLTNTQRGMALQQLFEYLLNKIPGLISRPNSIDPFRSEEIDIAVANTRMNNGLACFPNLFLVECKNWAAPVDAPTVGTFIDKMRNRRVELGILVAANGITGDPRSLSAAHHKVAMAQGDGLRVLFVTIDDVSKLSHSKDLAELLVDRLLLLIASGTSLGN